MPDSRSTAERSSGSRRLRVATYNVHGCVGRDGTCDPTRTAAVVKELRADVVGLQEVCFAGRDGGGQIRALGEATGTWAVASPLYATGRDWRGNGLLTRFPVADVRHHDVSVGDREPRGLLDVRLRVGSGELRLIVVHFGLRAFERTRQVEWLLETLSRSETAAIVVGDFNEWRPRARTLSRLRAALGRSAAPRTFPSNFPVLALDRIWTNTNRILGASAHRSPLATAASDHLPAWADVSLSQ